MLGALVELWVPSVCPACQRGRREGERLLCPPCAADLRPGTLHGPIRAALRYEGSAAQLLRRLKFEQRRDALRVLIEPLVAATSGLRADTLVAVPRHPERLREQACDPVHDLARALARRSGRRYARNVLSRSRATPPQTDLPRAERHRNVRGSFRARAAALRGRRVLLLDDVTTTGATLREAAAELRRTADPRSVVPFALAGTPIGRAPSVL